MAKRVRQWVHSALGADELPVDGESGAWAISLAAHVALLVLLAVAAFSLPGENRLVLSADPVDVDEELLPEEFRFAEELQQEIGALADAGATSAEAAAPLESLESEIVLPIEPVSDTGHTPAFEVQRPLLMGPHLSEDLVVKGVGSVGATGAAGAVDRITTEILLSLDHRPTLVVWLFDQSGSLREQRDEIARRFDRVYEELGVIKAGGAQAFAKHEDKPLLTSVAQFAAGVTLLTPEPTDDVADIKAAVRAVKEDDSGVENVFSAIGAMAQEFRTQRTRRPRRNVMIVAFTDEAGDDLGRLDDTVELCTRLEMPVYVVGVPAPFGRREAYVKYVHPNAERYDQTPIDVPVHQGPESLMPERIKLGFIGRDRTDPRERIDSGFGPFGLTRLAYQTGGKYFAVHPNRRVGAGVRRGETEELSAYLSAFFDPRIMRRYRPEYVTVKEYQQMLSRNRARAALVNAAAFSWTTPMEEVRQTFEKVDEAQLAEALTRAQREAAKLAPKLNRLVTTLQSGERDRPKLREPRWHAGYDLAMGRALAAQVRTEGYNAMLAQAKQGMKFRNERSDTWIIRPSDNISTGSVLEKAAEAAKEHLTRVATEHEGTPWALLAERELETPLGWEWKEEFRDVAGRRARMAAAAARPRPPQNVPPRREPPPVPKL